MALSTMTLSRSGTTRSAQAFTDWITDAAKGSALSSVMIVSQSTCACPLWQRAR
jgi:hypothetical protein